jgi:hypothetical protein
MSTFPQITSPPQASAEVLVNRMGESLEHQAVYGLKHSTTTGLSWAYYGGRWGGFAITDGVLMLTDASANYIVVEIASGDISVDTASTDWDDDTNYVRVYKVTTVGGVVTAVEDHRAGPGGVHGGAGGGGGGSGTVTNTGGDLDANAVVLGAGGDDATVMASLGSSGQVLTSAGVGAPPTWETPSGGGSGTKTYAVFTPMTSQPPASNYATLDTRNSIAVLDFDAVTEEAVHWVGVMPEGASLGSGLKVRIHWMATSATANDVVWGASFEAMTTDLDSDSFDTETTATGTANGTSGIETVTEITCTTIDSIAAGGLYRLKIARKAAAGGDNMSGDAELIAVEVRSAA